jgi:hypothetical protein
MRYVCCRCGWDNPRDVDGWLDKVGGVCAEHALEEWTREDEEANRRGN